MSTDACSTLGEVFANQTTLSFGNVVATPTIPSSTSIRTPDMFNNTANGLWEDITLFRNKQISVQQAMIGAVCAHGFIALAVVIYFAAKAMVEGCKSLKRYWATTNPEKAKVA